MKLARNAVTALQRENAALKAENALLRVHNDRLLQRSADVVAAMQRLFGELGKARIEQRLDDGTVRSGPFFTVLAFDDMAAFPKMEG
jgi:hypothetical protein